MTRFLCRAALLTAVAIGLISTSASFAAEQRRPRIVAVGDVHGSPEAFSELLRAAGLVDESGAWIGGSATLVQTGDLTDRGPGVRAVLDQMIELERSAAENGGRVVALLGNHEVFNLIGYYDYESTPLPVFAEIAAAFETDESEKKRKSAYRQWSSWLRRYPHCGIKSKAAWMARNPLGFVEYQDAMSARSEYGRWLRDREVVIEIDGTLFVHGGLSPELLEMEVSSLDAINARARADLDQFDRDREALERDDIITRYSTLGELFCAVSFELEDLAESNDVKDRLRRARLEEIRGRIPSASGWFLLDPRGPVWFRGYANWSDEEGADGLKAVFETFGGSRIAVGHTPQPGAVKARFSDRVFLIDTAMAYPELKGRALALEILGDAVSQIGAEGRTTLTPVQGKGAEEPGSDAEVDRSPALEAVEAVNGWSDRRLHSNLGKAAAAGLGPKAARAMHSSSRPSGNDEATAPRWLGEAGRPLPFADDRAVLDFLRDAKVIERRAIGKGTTLAQVLTLEDANGIRARAAFHDVHVEERRRRERDRIIVNFRDSYRNNVAAYELARLLGVTNLPPATIRRVGTDIGSMQLWIEGAYDESTRRNAGAVRPKTPHLARRSADMRVFDNLINNLDRNQGNMLYDARGELWMIDHTRSFSASSRLPSPERMERCSRSLFTAIRELDQALARDRLRPYLRRSEIKALFDRRQLVLNHLEDRIAKVGENRVLFSYEKLLDNSFTASSEDSSLEAAVSGPAPAGAALLERRAAA